MSHADRPYLTRPLAGVDQAVGEDGARRPVELLDQLRERLDRLDPNHPSASQRTSDLDQAQPREVQAGSPDRSSRQKESADASPGEQPNDHGAGEPQAVRESGRPAAADNSAAADNRIADNMGTDLAPDGQYRVMESHRTGTGERYRPWFADEPGTPWFAEPGFTE